MHAQHRTSHISIELRNYIREIVLFHTCTYIHILQEVSVLLDVVKIYLSAVTSGLDCMHSAASVLDCEACRSVSSKPSPVWFPVLGYSSQLSFKAYTFYSLLIIFVLHTYVKENTEITVRADMSFTIINTYHKYFFSQFRVHSHRTTRSTKSFPSLLLEIFISSNSRNLLQFLQCVTAQCTL